MSTVFFSMFFCTQSKCTHDANAGYSFFLLETLSEVRDRQKRRIDFNSECQHATASEVALCLPNGTAHRLRIAEQFGFLLPYMP
jgi:hypothetical protein